MLIKIADKEYNDQELMTLAKAGVLNIGQKNDPASTTLTAQALHGPFQGNAAQLGLFSGSGVRPQRFSALSRPQSWLDIVPIRTSRYTNELLEIMTGQLAGGTTNATGFCGNPPVVGNLKVMRRTFTWGSYYVKTDLNAAPLLGQLVNRADVPGEILNAGPVGHPFIPDLMFRLDDTESQLQLELFKIGVDLGRTIEPVSMRGIAATDNSRTGWFAEFAGLDGMIQTGYTDSVTGIAAPAADSVVESFDALITGNSSDGTSRDIITMLTDAYYAVRDRAADVGMDGTVWAIVMRKEAFRELTYTWACSYATYRCTTATNAAQTQDTFDVTSLRLQMLNGQYLLIDGVQVPVVFSEGIAHETLANQTYKSDLYIVPISWNGLPLIAVEYFPMNNAVIQEFASFVDPNSVTVMNNGMFMVGKRDTGFCFEYHFAARFRLILETPFLAGRVDDLQYTYRAQTREATPGASLYADGGVSYR